MLFWILITAAVVLVAAATVQWMIARLFERHFLRQMEQQPTIADSISERVAVLLCVRGCDPSLRSSLISVLNQQHPNFEVHVVVDHRTDAAWELVHEVQRDHDSQRRMTIHELNSPSTTCGLKCSSLVQGLSSVSESVKYLVLLDSDVETHSTWIQELINPLATDETIGLVTGNQWFEPPAGSTVGALVRSSWNAGALVPTMFYKNPWAGTFAMRMEDVRQSNLTSVWKNSVVDDGPLRRVINSLNKRIHFAPSLIMINRENCTFGYSQRWVTRMLTWSRLYEPTFGLTILHSLFSNTVMVATMIGLLIGFWSSNFLLATLTLASLLVSGFLSVAAYLTVRRIVQLSCGLRRESLPPLGAVRFSKLLLMVPVVQLVFGWACLRAVLARQVRWREITYLLHGRSLVRMQEYRPYQGSKSSTETNVSI